ncbi:Asp-tRNAAsn/Glu-tRNAGln amidotransferase A subunit [Streptomyces sp. WMMB 714]|uniref:amidase n=1 Tax=Streptomyces sp. WMMB 714 TaxID=1286822 RepID=UPI000823CEEE|nr:amidase [Streptomyces sp. WMMB 714]SCK31769.1 Asp-tRNAAsn/Glu-tRNAGln amidotransferase A subunit [Streptomyces sp. WMMB 714]
MTMQTDSEKAVWRERGAPLVAPAAAGPLSGVRLAVKDVHAVAGHRMGAGNPYWLREAEPETRNSWAVQALLDAGAEVTGIAQTDELTYSLDGTNAHYGTPPNPAAPGRIPGGSSSGPASAVALREADAGLGSDTAGSIRVPASYCGLYGMRPTHGAVPVTGMLPLAPRFDTVGWLARDAETLLRMGDALLPPAEDAGQGDEGRGAAGPEGSALFRTALVDESLLTPADDAVREGFAPAVEELAVRTGLRVERYPLLGPEGADCELRAGAFSAVQAVQVWENDGEWVAAHPDALGPGVAERFTWASTVTRERAERAAELVRATALGLDAALSPGTLLLLPAAAGPAPRVDSTPAERDDVRRRTIQLTCLAGIGGLPCVVLPHMTAGGLPVGLCAIAARGQDRALLRLALAGGARREG